MTSDPFLAAILAAILAHPADDGVRLVYADWFMEQGNATDWARGEFIKVQVESAKLKPRPLLRAIGSHSYQVTVGNKAEVVTDVDVEPLLATVSEPFGPMTRVGRDQTFAWRAGIGPALAVDVLLNASILAAELTFANIRHDRATCGFRLTGGEPDTAGRARQETLRRRERELLEAHGHDWIGKDWGSVINNAPTLTSPNGWNNDAFTFRRGFVEEITCDWPTWGGGPCSQCEGLGYENGRVNQRRCRLCSGTGRTLGHANAILASTPLRRCKLTSMPGVEIRPIILQSVGPGEYAWDASERRNEGRLEGCEWKSLDGLVSDMERHRATAAFLLRAEYPGVEFELPPARTFYAGRSASVTVRDTPYTLFSLDLRGEVVDTANFVNSANWRESAAGPIFTADLTVPGPETTGELATMLNEAVVTMPPDEHIGTTVTIQTSPGAPNGLHTIPITVRASTEEIVRPDGSVVTRTVTVEDA